jgi:hypothetical protein
MYAYALNVILWAFVFTGMAVSCYLLFMTAADAAAIRPYDYEVDLLTTKQQRLAEEVANNLFFRLILGVCGLGAIAFFKTDIFEVWWGIALFVGWALGALYASLFGMDYMQKHIEMQKRHGFVSVILPDIRSKEEDLRYEIYDLEAQIIYPRDNIDDLLKDLARN